MGAPSGAAVVTPVTPVAKRPNAVRKNCASKSGSVAGMQASEAGTGGASGRQAVDGPAAAAVGPVAQAVVQARRAALPELELGGHQAVAAPVLRARRLFAVLGADLLLARFQVGAAYRLALARKIGRAHV